MARDEASCASSPERRIDLDALLVALVLVPHSYPRNRFYSLYDDAQAERVRRRAALLRSLVGDLAGDAEDVRVEREDGGVTLRYALPDLGATRATRMDEEELALVELTARKASAELDLTARDRARDRVLARLERLMPAE